MSVSASASVSRVSSMMMIVPATAEVAADGTRDYGGGGGYEETVSSKELVMVVIHSRVIEEVRKCWC